MSTARQTILEFQVIKRGNEPLSSEYSVTPEECELYDNAERCWDDKIPEFPVDRKKLFGNILDLVNGKKYLLPDKFHSIGLGGDGGPGTFLELKTGLCSSSQPGSDWKNQDHSDSVELKTSLIGKNSSPQLNLSHVEVDEGLDALREYGELDPDTNLKFLHHRITKSSEKFTLDFDTNRIMILDRKTGNLVAHWNREPLLDKMASKMKNIVLVRVVKKELGPGLLIEFVRPRLLEGFMREEIVPLLKEFVVKIEIDCGKYDHDRGTKMRVGLKHLKRLWASDTSLEKALAVLG